MAPSPPQMAPLVKLLNCHLAVACKLSKTDQQPHFDTGRPLLQEGRTPNLRQFLPCIQFKYFKYIISLL